MGMTRRMKTLAFILHLLEDSLLIGVLAAMLLLAVFQILMRNFMDCGIVWGDAAVRILLLWVGLTGAMVAGRNQRHISIDIVTRYLPERWKRIVNAGVALATGLVCGIAAWHAAHFVQMEFAGGAVAFGQVPVWACGAIIPVCFGVLTLRYLNMAAMAFFSRSDSVP